MKTKEVVRVETDQELIEKYWEIWMISRNLVDIPTRRDWLDAMSIEFVKHPNVEFRFSDGRLYPLPDLDDAFGEPDLRWLHDFWECDGSNLHPKRSSPKIERLRIISLFLKLRYPRLRKHLDA